MLANCGRLGLNWAEVSLSGYLEAMEAHNDSMGEPARPEASDWLKRLVNGEPRGE